MTHRQKQWLIRIALGGLIGVAVLVPLGGLFNDLVSGGLIDMGSHSHFQLVSYELERLAGPAALVVQLLLYFAFGAVVGVSTLPFADDGKSLLLRSLAHFAVTAGMLALMVCLCGWNWGKWAPLLVYLILLALVYALIWLARWVGWYAEVAAIREKLGLDPGPSPLKWKETLPYVPFALGLCVVLPALLRVFDAPDVPVLSGILYPILMVVGCFFSGGFLAKHQGLCVLYPVLCGLFIIPTVSWLYHVDVLPYAAVAFLAALIGEVPGLVLKRARERKED